MIKKYNEYLNEKLSDKLSGKNDDEIIENFKNKPDELIKLAFTYNSYKFAHTALQNGDFYEYDNNSIFTYLVKNDKYELFEKILINKDIDVNEIDETDMVNVFEKFHLKKYQILILKYLNNKHLLNEILYSVISDNFTDIIILILDKNIFSDIELNDYFISINCGTIYSIDTIEIFLKHGADVNYENGELLLNALEYGNYDIIRFLLEHGAKIYDNKYFKDVINYIKNSTSENNKNIYELIKKYVSF